MRSDELSEWDEYISLNSIKLCIENAISRMAVFSDMLPKLEEAKKPNSVTARSLIETLQNLIHHLDVSRASLIAVRNELDHCSMVGTMIKREKEKPNEN